MHHHNRHRNLNICHVITRMNIGGAEENTLLSCMGLIEKGHQVTLITGPSTGPEGNLLEHAERKDLEVIEIPELVREISPKKDLLAYRKLRQIFRERKFNVVHTHASKAGILGRFAASAEHVPVVIHTVHGQPFHPFQNPLKNTIFKIAESLAARKCQKIFAVAQAMIEQCVEAHIAKREKYKLVYSGMNLEDFLNAKPDNQLRESMGLPIGVPVVGMIARMFPQKGYEDFLKVAPIIGEAFPDAWFLLLGDGTLRPKIEQELQRLGLRDRTIFTGMVPPQQVCNYIPFMNVLLHLSYHEGLPRTAVQALAAKTPVVAYPVDGTPEVVINGTTGFLVPTKNARMAAEKAIILIRSPKKRILMGETGRTIVQGKFSTRQMVETLDREYQEAIKTQQKVNA